MVQQSETHELQFLLDSYKKKAKQLNNQLIEARKQSKSLMQEITKLNKENIYEQPFTRIQVKDLDARPVEAKKEIQKMKKQVDFLKKENEELCMSNVQNKEKLEGMVQYQQILVRKINENDFKSSELAQKEQELRDLKVMSNTQEVENDRLGKTVDQLKALNQDLQRVNADLLRQNKEFSQKNDGLIKEVDGLRSMNKSLSQNQGNSQRLDQERQVNIDFNIDVNEELVQKMQNIEQVKLDISVNEEIVLKNKQLQNEIEALKREQKENRTEIKSLKRQVQLPEPQRMNNTVPEEEFEKVNDQNLGLRMKIQEIELNMQQQQGQINKAQLQNDDLLVKKSALEEKLQEAEQKRQMALNDLKQNQITLTQKEEDLEDLKDQLKDMQQNKTVDQQVHKLNNQKDQLIKEKAQLNHQLHNAESLHKEQLELKQKELSDLKKEVYGLRQEAQLLIEMFKLSDRSINIPSSLDSQSRAYKESNEQNQRFKNNDVVLTAGILDQLSKKINSMELEREYKSQTLSDMRKKDNKDKIIEDLEMQLLEMKTKLQGKENFYQSNLSKEYYSNSEYNADQIQLSDKVRNLLNQKGKLETECVVVQDELDKLNADKVKAAKEKERLEDEIDSLFDDIETAKSHLREYNQKLDMQKTQTAGLHQMDVGLEQEPEDQSFLKDSKPPTFREEKENRSSLQFPLPQLEEESPQRPSPSRKEDKGLQARCLELEKDNRYLQEKVLQMDKNYSKLCKAFKLNDSRLQQIITDIATPRVSRSPSPIPQRAQPGIQESPQYKLQGPSDSQRFSQNFKNNSDKYDSLGKLEGQEDQDSQQNKLNEFKNSKRALQSMNGKLEMEISDMKMKLDLANQEVTRLKQVVLDKEMESEFRKSDQVINSKLMMIRNYVSFISDRCQLLNEAFNNFSNKISQSLNYLNKLMISEMNSTVLIELEEGIRVLGKIQTDEEMTAAKVDIKASTKFETTFYDYIYQSFFKHSESLNEKVDAIQKLLKDKQDQFEQLTYHMRSVGIII